MRKIIFGAVLASLVLTFSYPAAAIDVVIQPPQPNLPTTGTNVAWNSNTGTILASGDFVQSTVSGGAWATVKISINPSATPAPLTFAYSIDGGVTFISSGAGAPYAKQVFPGTSNPVVQAFAAHTTTGMEAWEFPLAANVTNVKVFASSAGTTAQTVSISGLIPYVPGEPVVAVLNANAALGTGTYPATNAAYDLTGWAAVDLLAVTPATSTVTWTPVGDDASATVIGLGVIIPPSSTTYAHGSRFSGPSGLSSTLTAGTNAWIPMTRRANIVVGTLAANVRLEVSR